MKIKGTYHYHMCPVFKNGDMEKIQIGKIVNAVALKGEVKIYPYSEPSRFEEIGKLYIENKQYEIQNVRMQGTTVIVKLKGIDDRNAAEEQRNKYVYITEEQLPELPEDEYYIRDLIGMTVETVDGEYIGVLNDVLQNTAQDVYEVKKDDGKMVLIPGVAAFIIDINMETKKISVNVPEGLLDL